MSFQINDNCNPCFLLGEDKQLSSLDFKLFESYRQNYKALRTEISKKTLQPFAFLEIFPKTKNEQTITHAEELLIKGWSMGTGPVVRLTPPITWYITPRSVEFHLNAWLPVQRLLTAFDIDKSWSYFQPALEIIEDWINACPIQLANKSLEDAVMQAVKEHDKEGSWWYDMSIAQRLSQLAYVVDVCCRNPEISDKRIFTMMDHILLHHMLLTLDLFYKKNTNHGLFQALHQYAAITRLPEFDYQEYFLKTTHNRLQQMITQQYTSEMVHREHSPGYHYMITVALMNASKAGLLDNDKNLKLQLKLAQEALGWMIIPSGQLVTFGDTDPRNLFTQDEIEFFEESSLVNIVSQQKQLVGVKHYTEAGYAFARLYASAADVNKPQQASYLAQISGFHSRTHKHADHLSFLWFDKGRDILIDPGRYAYTRRTAKGSDLFNQGFWYSDPRRIYCERTRAHNTIEIDGKDFLRKNVKPFGSALLYAQEKNGDAITYSKVIHFRSIQHHRQLIMRPGHFLLVLDWLKDGANAEHEYKQYFHFGSEWDLSNQGDQIIGHHPGNEKAEAIDLRVVSLIAQSSIGEVVRGQEEPELLGWLSNAAQSLIPTSCFHVYQCSDKPVSFATLFVFGKKLDINWQKTRFNNSLSAGRVVWSDDLGEQVLDITKLA